MLPPLERTRDLSPPKCSIYLHQLFRFGFAVSSQLTCDVGLYRVSVRHLMGLGENASDDEFAKNPCPIQFSSNRTALWR
jgi:hypothetical protein